MFRAELTALGEKEGLLTSLRTIRLDDPGVQPEGQTEVGRKRKSGGHVFDVLDQNRAWAKRDELLIARR